MPLSLHDANALVAAAQVAADDASLRMSVAVLDAGGHLLAFGRSDAANLATIEIAIRKARTSVFFKAPTRFLSAALQPGGALYGAADGDGLIGIAGGIPILDGLVLVGSIGVSGGTPEQDDQIAAGALATRA